MAQSGTTTLDRLLKPRSVAIIGASDDPARLPGMSLDYLKQAGFSGPIWPVNPKRDMVQGLQSYPSVAALPEVPDVAIVAASANLVQQAVEDCARHGVGAVIIFAVGFAEAGEEGQAAEQKLLDTARAANMRVLGPNCLGCFNSVQGFYGTISISLAAGLPVASNVAVVSQSGAYGEQVSYLLKRRGIGARYLVTTGNEGDVDVGEAIHWMADQSDVDVIVAYSEGVNNPAQFVAALDHARQNNKQIIYMKVGRSSAGMAAAASHTASLAGDDRIWDAVFSKHGVFRARSTEEQVDMAYAASRRLFPAGRKLAILTVSGGFGIQLCDAAADVGLDVPPLKANITEKLKELMPFGSIQNPVDASGQIVGHLDKLKSAITCLACEAGYDATVVILGSVPLSPAMNGPLVKALVEAAPAVSDRLVVLCCVADAETVTRFEKAGYLVFADGHDAARAIAGLTAMSEARNRRPDQAGTITRSTDLRGAKYSEYNAKKLLGSVGIPVADEILVRSADEAEEAANTLGYPAVLKICSPEILHKTEIGGVLLSLPDEQAVRSGFEQLLERAAANGYPEDQVEGVIVTAMAPTGIETILGVQVDATFGPAVLFGLGGIHAEVLKDSAIRMAPISEAEAHAMIREVRAFPLLEGVRGAKRSDIDTLAQTLVSLSHFAVANAERLTTIDINPFVVYEEGEGAVALDALIVTKSQE